MRVAPRLSSGGPWCHSSLCIPKRGYLQSIQKPHDDADIQALRTGFQWDLLKESCEFCRTVWMSCSEICQCVCVCVHACVRACVGGWVGVCVCVRSTFKFAWGPKTRLSFEACASSSTCPLAFQNSLKHPCWSYDGTALNGINGPEPLVFNALSVQRWHWPSDIIRSLPCRHRRKDGSLHAARRLRDKCWIRLQVLWSDEMSLCTIRALEILTLHVKMVCVLEFWLWRQKDGVAT